MQGEGSIAKELYSEIMQPSVVGLGRESAAAQANDNLQGKLFYILLLICLSLSEYIILRMKLC